MDFLRQPMLMTNLNRYQGFANETTQPVSTNTYCLVLHAQKRLYIHHHDTKKHDALHLAISVILTHQIGHIDPPWVLDSKNAIVWQNYSVFLKLSPINSSLCEAWSKRSKMTSAIVSSPIASNQLATGN